jgi:hypothetical protein
VAIVTAHHVHQKKFRCATESVLMLSILVTRHEHTGSLVVSTFTSRSTDFHPIRPLWC